MFRASFGALLSASAFALLAVRAGGASPEADGLLAQARRTFRAHVRPPFVVYTLERREERNGYPDFANTYAMRIWYRSADRAALARRIDNGRARGALHFIRPVFNAPVDPGPPTADIFEPAPARREPRAAERPAGPPLLTIGTVRSAAELEYGAELAGTEGGAYHLRLVPRRDPERNILREIWIDRESFEVTRFISHDRLFDPFENFVPERLDVRMTSQSGLPLVESVYATTSIDADTRTFGTREEGRYRFSDLAFPPELPAWYFEPAAYRAHIGEAPEH